MAHLYPHKQKGWQVLYRVHFPDGTHRNVTRYSRKRQKAALILKEVGGLEDLSRRGTLTREEVAFYLNRGYITGQEAERLASGPVPGSTSWDELRIEYEKYSRRNCRPYTHDCNVGRVNTIIEYFKGRNPAELSPADVREYVAHRLKSRAMVRGGETRKDRDGNEIIIKSSSVAKELNVLRRLLDPLGPDYNPARKVASPKKRDERLPRNLREDEVLAFMRALRGRKRLMRGYLWPLALTCLYAGLRPSELVNLTPRDVDLRAGKFLVQGKDGYQTKTGYARSVEIHPRLDVHIRACLRRGGRYLFGGSAPFPAKSVGRAIRQTIDAAGLEGVTPYSLRHCFVTGLLRAGADVREVMEKAGHRRLSTTLRYLHTIPSDDPPVRRIRFGGGNRRGGKKDYEKD